MNQKHESWWKAEQQAEIVAGLTREIQVGHISSACAQYYLFTF